MFPIINVIVASIITNFKPNTTNTYPRPPLPQNQTLNPIVLG